MAASQDNCGSNEESVPQWKRELILRRRALARTLPAGNSTVQLTCPSVVAAVRLAESVPGAAGENYRDNSQRSASISAKKSSLDQQQAYFHPGFSSQSSSSTVDSVGENMRLVEHETAPGLRRSLPVGVDLDSNKTLDALTYRSIMGEEKSVKKSCASNRRMENNNAVKSVGFVLGENNNGNHPKDDDCQSDSSEELQYGPGIVNKLKSKYMSMTLRETKNKVRPSLSQLRRAASMENMLEDNDENDKGKPPLIKPQHKFTKRTEVTSHTANKYQTQQRYRSSSRGNESIKRARSVEALLNYETKPQLRASQLPSPSETRKLLLKSLSKDDIIIVEKSPPVAVEEKPPIPQSALARKKRPTMNGSQKSERPPADVVKQTLKLFESSQPKTATVTSSSKVVGPPTIAKLNISIANKPVPASNKPLLSPKPSPEKIRRSPLSKVPPKKASPPTPTVPPPLPVAVPELEPTPEVQSKAPLPVSTESRNEPTSQIPELQIQRKLPMLPTSIELQQKPPSNDALRSPLTPPSRVLPLDLKPTVSQSSPTLVKSPSLTAIPVQGTLSPTNGVAKFPTQPRTPSPVARLKSPSPIQPRTTSPDVKTQTRSPEVKPRTTSPVKTVHNNSPAFIPRTPSPLTNGKPIVQDQGTSSDDEDMANGCVNKNISRSSLDNIRKSGSTEVFAFCNTSSEKSKPYLPTNGNQSSAYVPKTVPDKTPTPPARHPISPLRGSKSPESPSMKQVGIIRPIVNAGTKVQPSPLTDREKEKNHINSVKSNNEQPTKVVASIKPPSDVVVGNVSEALKGRVVEDGGVKGLKEVKSLRDKVNANSTGLWDNKKQQNVMKFDFSNRKDPIPDYIENAGIILRPKREPIRPGDGGFIILDPSLEESSATDETDDFNAGFLGPPSPCNVQFEGDNVVINGKSSLRGKQSKRKLRIQFNDDATQLFEYPSESSLMNDMINSAAASASTSGLAMIPPSPTGPTPGLPVPSGGSSLASYTSKVSMGTEDFQLGVSRTTPLPKPKQEADQSAAPATSVEDNVAWSTDTADDLLF